MRSAMLRSAKAMFSVLLAALFLLAAFGCNGADEQKTDAEQAYTGNTVHEEPYVEREGGEGTDFSVLYQKTYTSVVTVTIEYTVREQIGWQIVTEQKEAIGSGVVFDAEQGYILTSSYLFETANLELSCSVTFYDGTAMEAELVACDAHSSLYPFNSTTFYNSDIAVVEVTGVFDGTQTLPQGVTAAVFGNSSEVEYGQSCYTIGTVLTENGAIANVLESDIVTKPYITHESRFQLADGGIWGMERNLFDGSFGYLIMTGLTLREGNAGAPLFDAHGNVVGMLNYRAEGTRIMQDANVYGISFATPASTLKAFLNEFYKSTGGNVSFADDIRTLTSIFSDACTLEGAAMTSRDERDPVYALTELYDDYFMVGDESEIVFTDETYAETGETAAERVASQRINSTVKIVCYVYTGSSYGVTEGSGFIINSDGYLITNLHVVNRLVDETNSVGNINAQVDPEIGSGWFYAIFENGFVDDSNARKYALLRLEVVAFDKTGDLALLRFVNGISHEESGKTVTGFSENTVCAFETDVAFGEAVFAIGNPEGFGVVLSQGVVSNPAATVYESEVGYKHVLTDCPINSGNSGGPLFNAEGNVVAVNALGLNIDSYPGYENTSWSIRADAVVTFLDTANAIANGTLKTSAQIGEYGGNGRVFVRADRLQEEAAYRLA